MKNLILSLFAVIVLASCSEGMPNFSLPDISLGSSNSAFYENLANEYKNLASYEEEFMGNLEDAEYLRTKARRALRKQDIAPENPQEHNIPEFAQAELYDAYNMLIDALDNMQAENNNALLAMAQTRYDCWVLHQEDFPTEKAKLTCRDDFHNALALLDIHKEDMKVYSIYFDSGATALNDEAHQAIEEFAKRYVDRPEWEVTLKGYTDSTGNKYQNERLSMRRAIAVKNILGQYGINLENIEISAEGEVTEEDAADERRSRRVDIEARPRYVTANKTNLHVAPGWRHSVTH